MQLLLTEPLFRGWHFTGKHAYNDARNMKNFCQSLIDPEMIFNHNHDCAEKISIKTCLKIFNQGPTKKK